MLDRVLIQFKPKRRMRHSTRIQLPVQLLATIAAFFGAASLVFPARYLMFLTIGAINAI
jgi:hypothetical protein